MPAKAQDRASEGREVLAKLRGVFLNQERFWGFIATDCEYREVQGMGKPFGSAIRVDGHPIILYDPEVLADFRPGELFGDMLHVLRHLVNLHPLRGHHASDRREINAIADAIVHQDSAVTSNLRRTIDPWRLSDLKIDAGKPWSLEQAYGEFQWTKPQVKEGQDLFDLLPKRDHPDFHNLWGKPLPKSGSGSGDGDGSENSQGASGMEGVDGMGIAAVMEAARQTMRNLLERAATAGTAPGDLGQLLDNLRPPKVPWIHETRHWLRKNLHLDRERSFTRPPRKKVRGLPVVLPGRSRKTGYRIAVLFDMSGSVPDSDCEQFFGEIDRGILPYAEVHLITFDGDARPPVRYRKGDWRKTKMDRGGTRILPALEKAKQIRDLSAIVILTDGDTADEAKEPPGVPVLWVLTRNRPIPFGKKIVIDSNGW